jgi:O-antigen/teichoic acid export membrane protein
VRDVAGPVGPTPWRDETVTAQARARNETEAQRIDRNYLELLQELRVAQTGTQILFAFLLTMAFTDRFEDITDFQRWVYVATLLSAAVASVLLIGPVPMHRMLFRRQLKNELVNAANRMAIAGLAMLAVALHGAVLLALDVALGGWVPFAAVGALAVWCVLLWYVVPLRYRRTPRTDYP